jgi:hypothetical protein
MQEVIRRSRAIGLGAACIFDLTGVLVYAIMRRALAAPQPVRSVLEPLRLSASTITDAYREALGSITRSPH